MDPLRRYDALFSRLLFDAPFRRRIGAGDVSELGAEADAFSVVDLEVCESFAAAIRDGLVDGKLGGLGIGRAFPDTVDALGGDARAVVERFLQAHARTRAFDGTCRQAGVSLFESFFDWAAPQLAHRPQDLRGAQHELARALFRILAGKPDPGFRVEWPLARRFARGWFCLLDADRPLRGPHDRPERPVAFVAALGQLVTGEDALEFVAVALEGETPRPAWVEARLARLDPAFLETLRRMLSPPSATG